VYARHCERVRVCERVGVGANVLTHDPTHTYKQGLFWKTASFLPPSFLHWLRCSLMWPIDQGLDQDQRDWRHRGRSSKTFQICKGSQICLCSFQVAYQRKVCHVNVVSDNTICICSLNVGTSHSQPCAPRENGIYTCMYVCVYVFTYFHVNIVMYIHICPHLYVFI
jgi:hypothetical protein